jgi:hypothetical protein
VQFGVDSKGLFYIIIQILKPGKAMILRTLAINPRKKTNQIKLPALQPCRAQAAVNTVPQPNLVKMRSRWLAYRPNTRIRIILIQQPV